MAAITLLIFGDVVGKPGRAGIRHSIPILKSRFDPALVIANAENSANGSGITPPTLHQICGYGVQVLTSGDHIFRNKDFTGVINDPRVLRPANYPAAASGRGWNVFEARGGTLVGVLNLMGRIFMEPHGCPFDAADKALEEMAKRPNPPKVILVDMHCEATSEKQAMGWYLDGRVSGVVGTHTHVQTADERVLPNGTAYLTDLGMTGPYDSVIGREIKPVLHKMRTGMPMKFEVANARIQACGAALKVDTETGKALSIERFQVPVASDVD